MAGPAAPVPPADGRAPNEPVRASNTAPIAAGQYLGLKGSSNSAIGRPLLRHRALDLDDERREGGRTAGCRGRGSGCGPDGEGLR